MSAAVRTGRRISPAAEPRAPLAADGAAWPARGWPPRGWAGPGLVRVAAALLGLAVIVTYLVIAVARLSYPFTLEWLESNSLVEVHRILTGQALYPPPTVSYVPDGYPPLYFAVSAGAASVFGGSYLPLRLVSLVSSLVCFALVARLVQRETASACAGAAAAGVLAATYVVTDLWFDIARVDSLFLAFSVAALYTARWMRSTSGAVATGLLLAAAFLTKQVGAAEGVAVLAAVACGSRRRLAVPAALTYGAVLGLSTLVLGLTSHGWYVYYVFQLLGEHGLSTAAFGQFFTLYLLPALGIAGCAVVLGVRRTPLVLVAGCGALVVEAAAGLVHSGGIANDLLPAYLAVALLAGLAMGGQPGGLAGYWADRLARARIADWPAGRSGRWVGAAAAALVIAQLAMLFGGFHPGRAIPPNADRTVGRNLVAGLRAVGGLIAVPADPGLTLTAGLSPVAHQGATYDVLRGSNRAAIASFTGSAAQAVAARRFGAIVTDLAGPPAGYPADLNRYYRRCPQTLLAGVPQGLFRPSTGNRGRPTFVWLPAGHGSCAETVRAIDGLAAGLVAAPLASGESGGTR